MLLSWVDPIGALQKYGVQYYQEEDNVISVEGVVKYVRKIVGYEQGIFDM